MKKIKLCALLLVVIFNLMFVSSCWIAFYNPYNPDKAYETGDSFYPGYEVQYQGCDILIRSEKNIFNIDDVSLELLMGLYFDRFRDDGIDENSDGPFSVNCVFFEYVNNREDLKNPVFTGEVPPFIEELTIFHEVVLKKINIDDIVNGKYRRTMEENSRHYIYNNSEIITIPKECFDKENGEFCIGVKEDYYYIELFYFRYYKTDENTIRIEFEYENFRHNRDIEVEEIFSWEIKALKKYYLDKHNEELEK